VFIFLAYVFERLLPADVTIPAEEGAATPRHAG